jgi:hypothetical protein
VQHICLLMDYIIMYQKGFYDGIPCGFYSTYSWNTFSDQTPLVAQHLCVLLVCTMYNVLNIQMVTSSAMFPTEEPSGKKPHYMRARQVI